MTIDTTTLTRLDAALADALAASEGFRPLLEAEHEALRTADLSALSELIGRKRSHTETLLTAAQALLQWCADQDLEPDYAAFEAWTRHLPEAERAPRLERWQALRQSLAANDRSNAVNRQVLASLTARNQAKLTLLKNLLGPAETYSASGTRQTASPTGWVDKV